MNEPPQRASPFAIVKENRARFKYIRIERVGDCRFGETFGESRYTSGGVITPGN
jgi:hypothetical protein